jgi:hypothetical protein
MYACSDLYELRRLEKAGPDIVVSILMIDELHLFDRD